MCIRDSLRTLISIVVPHALVYVSAEDQPEDVMIANIARTCFPELSLSRLREVEAEHDSFMAVLPIFYCGFPFLFFFLSIFFLLIENKVPVFFCFVYCCC